MEKSTDGFTMIELLVFITVLSFFFVTAAAVTVTSLRNIKINEHRILATRYAEELDVWLRAKKEADWNLFMDNVGTPGNQSVYCFDTTPLDADSPWPATVPNPNTNCGLDDLNPNIYGRRLVIRNQGDTEATATISVMWYEGGRDYDVTISPIYAVWE